jgi:transketolase
MHKLQKKAMAIRRRVINMAHKSKHGHIGSALSTVDVIAALYFRVLNIDPSNPSEDNRDRFILSKGHGAAALYAALAERGFFDPALIEAYLEDGSILASHPTVYSQNLPGIEFSTGSLGHGLSVAAGMALAAKLDSRRSKVFVMISDGECDEGCTWEAALFAAHHGLDNLTVIIDYNKIQAFGRIKDVMKLEPLADKWRSFGFGTKEVDGHDMKEIVKTMEKLPIEPGKPTAIIAHTTLGKGVDFMEDRLAWHYNVLTDELYNKALAQLIDAEIVSKITN